MKLIIKPIIGSGSRGIKYVKSKSELSQISIDFKKYFVQELLNNKKDVEAGFFLCDNGKIYSFYSHKRIRTYPESGGVTVFSKSDINDKILSWLTSLFEEHHLTFH